MATGSGTGTAASRPGTTSRAELVDRIRRRFRGSAGTTTIIQCINDAIRSAEHWLIPKQDTTTITFDGDDYDYTLPIDVVQLLQIWTRGDTDEGWVEIPSFMWRVYGTPGSQSVYFDTTSGVDDGDTIRLVYLARLSEMTSTSSEISIGAPAEPQVIRYITEYALHLLHEREAAKAGTIAAFEGHSSMAQAHFAKAQAILQRALRMRPAGRVHPAFPNRSIG